MPKKLRAVLVGCGGISGAWLDAAAAIPDFALAGLVDLNLEAARKCVTQRKLDVPIGTDLRAMLEKTKPDIVFDCTIPAVHPKVTLEALRHGCHVLGEKPMADSMPNARRMAAAARKAGKLYAVLQNRRATPPIRAYKKALGQIGQLTTLHSDFFIAPHFGGFREQMRHVLLLDMAIHTFDSARFLLGADAVSVYAQDWNPRGSWYKHGASALAIFEMTGGLVYTYRGGWSADGLSTSWDAEWRAIGTKGTLAWDGHDQYRGEVLAKPGGFTSTYRPAKLPKPRKESWTIGHVQIIHDFVAAVRAGGRRQPETVCSDNIKSLAMVFAAIRSAETGRKVKVVA